MEVQYTLRPLKYVFPFFLLALLVGCAVSRKAPLPEDLPFPTKPPPVTGKPVLPEDPRAGRQVEASLGEKDVPGIQKNYLLYLPKGYPGESPWPLLLFLHGSGERGNDIDRVKRHGPPRLADEGTDFPFVIVSPQCPAGETWSAESLDRFLDKMLKRYRIDRNRVYVSGLSLGGYGTWDLAGTFPERFAAAAPVCGGGDPARAGAMKDLPLWVFHGEKDWVVPVEKSREMVDALKKVNGKVKFTMYPDTGHDAWTPAYSNPALYQWFLEHRK